MVDFSRLRKYTVMQAWRHGRPQQALKATVMTGVETWWTSAGSESTQWKYGGPQQALKVHSDDRHGDMVDLSRL